MDTVMETLGSILTARTGRAAAAFAAAYQRLKTIDVSKVVTAEVIEERVQRTGQLYEPCPRCGREPVFMPLHLCERCWTKGA